MVNNQKYRLSQNFERSRINTGIYLFSVLYCIFQQDSAKVIRPMFSLQMPYGLYPWFVVQRIGPPNRSSSTPYLVTGFFTVDKGNNRQISAFVYRQRDPQNTSFYRCAKNHLLNSLKQMYNIFSKTKTDFSFPVREWAGIVPLFFCPTLVALQVRLTSWPGNAQFAK